MYLNANMDVIIVHFALLLLLFKTVNSEKSEILNIQKDVWNEINDEGSEYGNASILSTFEEHMELNLYHAQLELRTEKLKFENAMLTTISEILGLSLNSTKQNSKMLGKIEELRYSVMKSMKKKNDLINEDNSEKNTLFESFYRFQISESLKEEYVIFLTHLQTLKFEIYKLDKHSLSRMDMIDDFRNLLHSSSNNKDIPEIPLNETNDEALPKFAIDEQINELERLQRLALLIKDQLDEMPKSENYDPDDDMDSEKTGQQTGLSEKPQVPRWLLTERDIEEIRTKYFFWMEIFENTDNPKIAILNEAIEEKGYTVKLFCKTMAEYFNLTSIMLECASKEDEECNEMVMKMFQEERFKKFQDFFAELVALKIFPSP